MDGYFDHLLAFLDHVVAERFLPIQHREMLLMDRSPSALLDRIMTYQPPSVPKWIDRETS